ncbi:MAG: DNA gyrase subunit A [Myxococcaceae bacterium]|nr:DNA gyrase subunit A [Myxococcaceae bacterium]MCA3014724.1 DNA gyrase subunit A [Myxococcaceae bacterium]
MSDDVKTPEAPPPAPPPGSIGNVLPISIESEMEDSYLAYSMSVIVGRALPDVRDGLKPVHRRVLYAMHELSNTYTRPYKKSARVVGDVIGKYHPHGDQSVYDTIVRLAQPWSMRYPLVDGQGNFGSMDGDSPAAMRYTEVRMERLTDEMLADLDKDTVDFGPNYDNTIAEPLVMPARFPNLLVNGSDGIAVGMATKIPPHNLGEVIDGVIHLIDHPKAVLAELMQLIKGPDFPTGGLIAGRDGIAEAYATGTGKITLKARAEIVTDKNERQQIIVTEIPFQLRKEKLIEDVAALVRDKKLEGISSIEDHTDSRGEKWATRIVIDVKRDAQAEVVLNNLFMQTAMQTTYGIVLLAIDQGQPKVLSLRDILERFIAHRREVVTRRSRFELKKAKERLHIVEGLLVATITRDFLDHLIAVIRASKDPDEARWGLMNIASPALYEHPSYVKLPKVDVGALKQSMELLAARARNAEPSYAGLTRAYEPGFSEAQAQSILDMRLQRLTGLQLEELFTELIDLVRTSARLEDILQNEASLLSVIKAELKEVRQKYADERRTEITGELTEMRVEDLIAEEDMVVTLSHAGYIKRTRLTEYRAQKRGGRGKTGATTKEDDFVTDIFVASTHAYVLPLTTRGRLYWLKVHEIPEGSRTSKGKPIVNLVQFTEGETLAQMLVTKEFTESRFVLFVTRNGTVKRTDLTAFSNVRSSGIAAITIEDGDALVAVKITDGTKDVLLSTAQGMSIRFAEEEVRSMGRGAVGVKGITLEAGDEVVSAEVVEKGTTLLTVTENGYGKRTLEDEYRTQGRGGKGIIDIKTTERNGRVVGAVQVRDTDEVMIVTTSGVLIRMKVKDISVIGRNTQGVRLITLDGADEKVAGLSHVPEVKDDELGEAPVDGEPGEAAPPAVNGQAPGADGATGVTVPATSGLDGAGGGDGEPSP